MLTKLDWSIQFYFSDDNTIRAILYLQLLYYLKVKFIRRNQGNKNGIFDGKTFRTGLYTFYFRVMQSSC
jgi:hypothetical protein